MFTPADHKKTTTTNKQTNKQKTSLWPNGSAFGVDIFPGDLKVDTPVASQSGARRYRVSAGIG